MADSMRFMDWFKKAENDLHGAKILFQYEADYGNVAGMYDNSGGKIRSFSYVNIPEI